MGVERWLYVPIDGVVEVGPFVGIPRLTDPPPLGTLQGHRMAWDILGGVPPDVWSLRLMTEQYSPIWRIVMPGAPPVLRLPDVATLPTIPPGRHLLTFGGGLKEGFAMDSFEYSDLSVRGWDAWSSEWEELTVGGQGAP